MKVRNPEHREYGIKIVRPWLFYIQCEVCGFEYKQTTMWRYKENSDRLFLNKKYVCTQCALTYDDAIEVAKYDNPDKYRRDHGIKWRDKGSTE